MQKPIYAADFYHPPQQQKSYHATSPGQLQLTRLIANKNAWRRAKAIPASKQLAAKGRQKKIVLTDPFIFYLYYVDRANDASTWEVPLLRELQQWMNLLEKLIVGFVVYVAHAGGIRRQKANDIFSLADIVALDKETIFALMLEQHGINADDIVVLDSPAISQFFADNCPHDYAKLFKVGQKNEYDSLPCELSTMAYPWLTPLFLLTTIYHRYALIKMLSIIVKQGGVIVADNLKCFHQDETVRGEALRLCYELLQLNPDIKFTLISPSDVGADFSKALAHAYIPYASFTCHVKGVYLSHKLAELSSVASAQMALACESVRVIYSDNAATFALRNAHQC